MKSITGVLAGALLMVVVSFQACTPGNQARQPNSEKPNSNESANNGMPFDGKALATFQTQDPEFCAKANSNGSVLRNEVVRDERGHWLSVKDCKSVPATMIDTQIEHSTNSDAIRLENQVIPKVELPKVQRFRRVQCYVAGTDHLAVIVYESKNGLTMHYPRKYEMPNFIPVSAVHETGLDIVVHHWQWPPEGKTFISRYSSAYWNEFYSGQFSLILMSDKVGRVYGRWDLKTNDGTKQYKNAGPCDIVASKFPW